MTTPSCTIREAVATGSIVFSACAYLFDFVSNVVVLVQYSARYVQLSSTLRTRRPLEEAELATLHHQKSELAGYLFALLAILVFCHSLNALLFKLKMKAGSNGFHLSPIYAAYFLPLIHFYRLANLVWCTLSCQGVRDLTCPLVNGLYCILGSSLEGVPMLVLQFCGYLVLTREGVFAASMWVTFKVSVAASLLSAAYNGGTSAQSVACTEMSSMKEKTLVATVGAGMTLCATMVRCLTFANVIVHIREHFSKTRSIQEQSKFNASDSIPLVVIASCITGYTLFFMLFHKNKSGNPKAAGTRFLTSLVFAYMSMMMGPLYALLSDAAEGGYLGKRSFRIKLFTIFILHLSVDIGILVVTMTLGTLARPFFIASLLGILGCVGFLLAFIKVDAWRNRYNITQREERSASLSPSLSLSPSPSPSPNGKVSVPIVIPQLTDLELCTKSYEERNDNKDMDVQNTCVPSTMPDMPPQSPWPLPLPLQKGEVHVQIVIPELTKPEWCSEGYEEKNGK